MYMNFNELQGHVSKLYTFWAKTLVGRGSSFEFLVLRA
jgi:hypothetical protein